MKTAILMINFIKGGISDHKYQDAFSICLYKIYLRMWYKYFSDQWAVSKIFIKRASDVIGIFKRNEDRSIYEQQRQQADNLVYNLMCFFHV